MRFFAPWRKTGSGRTSEGRILRALNFKFDDAGGLRWWPNPDELFRYVPMALMGVTMWRMSQLGDERYDEKLLRNLDYFRGLFQDSQTLHKVPSYGAGPLIYAFSGLQELWPEERLDETADLIADFALSTYPFRYNEDSLVLMGLASRCDRLSSQQRQRLRQGAATLRSIQDATGLYRMNDDRGSFRHQNQMYAIWGLGHSDLALGENSSAEGIRRCLQYTIEHRMQPDGALLWHHYRDWLHRLHNAVHTMLGRVPEHIRLYSCHQAFFIYAVQVYRTLNKDLTAFTSERDNALRWEYGQNVRGEDLFERSGIGVPMRIMLTSGELDVPTQRFIGVYEIGAMIMCMVALLEELSEQGQRRPSALSELNPPWRRHPANSRPLCEETAPQWGSPERPSPNAGTLT